ncbi:hypothetical protein SNE35_28995 [Paucibacter sp. R3-3]|uniref:Alpha/beta hydrolase n=1 Tax=Roseateles agri TaxID=3098619 RepID=A0ABU5DQH4_9BURK|nr:hypothetical protein [Paucibacter sp. R3-3]MDY0748571.1 hypothetical protein [Paucibacter sp. R3-3]
MNVPNRHLPSATLVFISALLLAACSGPGPHRAPPDREAQARVAQLTASGYRAPEQALTVTMQRWIIAGEALPVDLALPAGSAGRLPLIVYLPGMGESARAGVRWRQLWAHAGYAVLSVQPLPDDELAWSSELARAADFKGLARERRQPAQTEARLRIILAVLEQARARAAAGDALMRRVDFGNVGIAAYELGAQAALAAPLQAQAKALLLLGPVLPERTESIATPLLLVSSRRDQDPTGLDPDPPKRSRAAFEAQDSATLLMLGRASHTALAGAPELGPDELDEPSSGRGRRGGGRREPTFSDAAPVRANEDDSAVVIEAASLAFWDANLRGSSEARGWLRERAPAWSQGLAEWSSHQR